MARQVQTIRIESILGGEAPSSNFAAEDQFDRCLGIDPDWPLIDVDGTVLSENNFAPSLVLRPTALANVSSGLSDSPMWIKDQPKDGVTYVYGDAGSVYSINAILTTVTGLGDLNDGGNANGNGAAYYDNYMYFSRDTTIARYGPLNGTPAFTDDYWVNSLGLTALTEQSYPTLGIGSYKMPDHVMHRHTDGKLYIADVVGNQGTLHYIKTTKASVEGDTNNGSTYDALNFGFGYWPTCMASYGEYLVIGIMEAGSTYQPRYKGAKLAFWDTTSERINFILDTEFAEPLITSIINVAGVLYIFTGTQTDSSSDGGVRVLRYVGGNSLEEVVYIPNILPPRPGAIDHANGHIYFATGSNVSAPDISISESIHASCVYKIRNVNTNPSVFNSFLTKSTGLGAPDAATALVVTFPNEGPSHTFPIVGWEDGTTRGIDGFVVGSDSAGAFWRSQVFRVGQTFKVTKIRLPLGLPVAANMTLKVRINTDEYQNTHVVDTIDNTGQYSGKQNIILRPNGITGEHSFNIDLTWSGTVPLPVTLPITIEYELIDD